VHGDELGRTQHGNNNTYAQDSELSWVHWDAADRPLVEFTSAVSQLRKDHPTFRRSRFFDGRPVESEESPEGPMPDIVWLRPNGTQMRPRDWDAPLGRAVGVYLNGNGIRQRDARGEPITDVDFLLFYNAEPEAAQFTIPPRTHQQWDVVIDTAGRTADSAPKSAGEAFELEARSMLVLRAHTEPEVEPDHSVAASLAVRTSQSDQPPRATKGPVVSGRPQAAKAKPAD
jgi:isoamylase